MSSKDQSIVNAFVVFICNFILQDSGIDINSHSDNHLFVKDFDHLTSGSPNWSRVEKNEKSMIVVRCDRSVNIECMSDIRLRFLFRSEFPQELGEFWDPS